MKVVQNKILKFLGVSLYELFGFVVVLRILIIYLFFKKKVLTYCFIACQMKSALVLSQIFRTISQLYGLCEIINVEFIARCTY